MNRLVLVILLTLLIVPASTAADIAVNESCSLADAINSANTDSAVGGCQTGDGVDTIKLSANITLDAALPHLTSDIIIEGDSYTISGAGRHTIFHVADGANLTINSLSMIEGNAKTCRPPDEYAEIAISRCIDDDYVRMGGAIVNVGSLTLTNCDFQYNAAMTKSSTGQLRDKGDGGAIANLGTLFVIDSAFSSNTAVSGGAIMNWGELSIANSAFSRNRATSYGSGGAIMSFGKMTMISIANSTFSLNSSELGRGGAIGNYRGLVSVHNSHFSQNSAGGSISSGGAIANWAWGELTIEVSTFRRNTATHGGAIKSGGGTELHISDSVFDSNSAEYNGGAVQAQQGKVTFITGSSFNGNSANGNGGALEVSYGDTVTIDNSSFKKNSATEVGGAIVNDEYSNLTIVGSMLGGNSANQGGAIGNWGDFTVSSSSFVGNSSASDGGAISNYKGSLSVINASFGKNLATNGKGGSIFANAGIVALTHVTIAYNAASLGGGIYVIGEEFEPLLVMNNSAIVSNRGGDCYSDTLDENHVNLIEDGSCFAKISGSAMFGELVEPDDGSPPYLPMLPDSPATDAASRQHCPATDQVGTSRPQGAGCDIGAIEFVGMSH